ncbi:hypothetical protein [Pseudoalteromonas aurantia]|uniref:Baseplate protein J-like domain-containing protein n=1 Tax=Pseudoalteromonas aurantia 208 TaxID=1314867 RepID=A0ABR9EHC0_9GAMM|nr:hypothetical protein [Pseudoalteromonas aurantia]MBE0370329.1 hypothetical protein [Pseudoalteromonas aurantia 208]
MTEKSNYPVHILSPLHQGLSQSQRRTEPLSSAFFQIEARTIEQWLVYLQQLAKQVRFIDEASVPNLQTWEQVLPDANQLASLANMLKNQVVSTDTQALASRPDLALLLTFIDLLQHTSAQFNAFVSRHLDHYFHDVLRFTKQVAQPDSAHVVITLGDIASMTLAEGVELDGGKDSEGNALIYHTTTPAAINHAQVDFAATLNRVITSESGQQASLQVARNVIFDAQTGQILEQSVPSLGTLSTEEGQPEVELGFKVASQDLFLLGGERVVTLQFATDRLGSTPVNVSDWQSVFDIYASTVDGPRLLAADTWAFESHAQSVDQTRLQITLSPLFPALSPADDEYIGGHLHLPYLSFVLKSDAYLSVYGEQASNQGLLSQIGIEHIKLNVKVTGASGVIASNSEGALDTQKPFDPFGLDPRLAAKFHFTHPELLCKDITYASLSFTWLDRPSDFNTYYKPYSFYLFTQADQSQNSEFFNESGRCTVEASDSTRAEEKVCSAVTSFDLNTLLDSTCDCLTWPDSEVKIYQSDKALGSELASEALSGKGHSTKLFYDDYDQDTLPIVVNNKAANTIEFTTADNNVAADYGTLPMAELDARQWPKWYSLELTSQDFGHKDYTRVVEYFAYQNGIALGKSPDNFIPIQVSPPYTPHLELVQLNYECESVTSAHSAVVGNTIWLEHIAPIGRQTLALNRMAQAKLLPEIDKLGYLYIALKDVVSPGQVSMYFQIDPIDGYNMGHSPKFLWEYFDNGHWQRLKREDSQGEAGEGRILQDSTYDLLDSGIIIFYLPKVGLENSFNHDGRLWLRASIEYDSVEYPTNESSIYPIYSRIRGMFTQGVEVTLKSIEHPQAHYEKPLSAEQIVKLAQPDPMVKQISQPYPSYDAKVTETTAAFNQRVSERLHHRGRLLTAWDFEHCVLQTFPQLHSTRAVHTSQGVTLIVIPLNYDPDVLQPKAPRYLKREVLNLIEALTVPGLAVKVEDPNYVEVQVELIVKINPLYDIQSSVIELNQLVIDTLTPWNKSESELSKTIYLTTLAQVLEQHVAVDMIQVIRAKRAGDNQNEYSALAPKDAQEILVPARNHKISLASVSGDVFEGIGKWEIEHDFKVQ